MKKSGLVEAVYPEITLSELQFRPRVVIHGVTASKVEIFLDYSVRAGEYRLGAFNLGQIVNPLQNLNRAADIDLKQTVFVLKGVEDNAIHYEWRCAGLNPSAGFVSLESVVQRLGNPAIRSNYLNVVWKRGDFEYPDS